MKRETQAISRCVCAAAALSTCVGALTLASGCSTSAKEPDEKAMRAGLQRKGPIDINSIPPNQRAIVQGFMNASKKGPPLPSTHVASAK